jgi:hypothetical protein
MGDGVCLDLRGAARYCRLAADQNHPAALLQLGLSLEFGVGTARRPDLAYRFYERASECECAFAFHHFGRHLEFGPYIGKDVSLAARCYESGAAKGDADSDAHFGFCLEEGLGTERDVVAAVRHYRESSDRGSETGRFHLSHSLHYGVGCDVDLDEAASFYQNRPSYVQDVSVIDSVRCLRRLNKAKLPVSEPQKSMTKREVMVQDFESTRPCTDAPLYSLLTDPLGTKLGRLLGVGGSGIVTLEQSPKTGEPVAVKHISCPGDRASFILEVENLWKVNHPCVLRILGWTFPYGSTRAQIQLEYARGGSLDRILADARAGKTCPPFWNATGIGIIMCGIVLGMTCVHNAGIIHGDLKPGNILLNEKGYPLIADFGSSHFIPDDATPLAECGTVYYAAPEQFLEHCVLTRKIDVFTFGFLLYELVTGSAVFTSSDSPYDVIRRLRNRDLPPVPVYCGSFMQELIPQCWLADPDARPSFDDIFCSFRALNYEVIPNAIPRELREFCEAILEWERKPGNRH